MTMSLWSQAKVAFHQLQLRERYWVFAASIGLLLWLGVIYLLEPLWHDIQQQQRQQQQLQQSLLSVQQQSQALELALQQDPDEQLRQQLADLSAEQAQVSAAIRQLSGRYVAPEQMVGLLQQVLAQQPKVRLLSLVNQSAEPLVLVGATDEAPVLFQHRLRFSFVGHFVDLQRMLQQLEVLPWQLHWRQLHYQVTDYPLAELTLELETVSEHEKFLRL